MVRSTDHPNMTIAVDWYRKNQAKPKQITKAVISLALSSSYLVRLDFFFSGVNLH